MRQSIQRGFDISIIWLQSEVNTRRRIYFDVPETLFGRHGVSFMAPPQNSGDYHTNRIATAEIGTP